MDKSLAEISSKVVSPVLPKYGTTEIVRGKGVYLYGVNGKRYLDFAAGIGVANTGHCHPKVVEAAHHQIDELIHACIHVSWYPSYVQLAEKIANLIPSLGMSFFCNSGTEAVEGALKLARFVTQRPGIVAFHGAFHGRTLGAASVSGKALLRRHYEPLLPAVFQVPYPWCFHCSYSQKIETCKYECYQGFEQVFHTSINPEETAAVIIEPIMGEGGYYVAPDKFLQDLRKYCDKFGILLIVDEVQSGMGRTGKMFAWQHIPDFIPDIMTLAKGLASGFPIGAVLAKPEIMSKWEKGAHGSTFGGNPVSCAAALATLEIFEGEGILSNAITVGKYVFDKLMNLKAQYAGIGDVRGRGLMLAMEFINPDGSPDASRVKSIIKEAEAQGLIIISGGINSNVIRIIPPLIINFEQVDEGITVLTNTIKNSN